MATANMAHKRNRNDFETDLQRQESPYVVYGTPLPQLDDRSRDDGSYVPIWKQEVTDDRGRKRLHGAFTGGFSAGYYNTVGSKEGWTPSTFVSSRTNRANALNQAHLRPEDYMDEEDIREQEEAKQVSADEDFSGFGTVDDENHKSTLMDLFRPAEDTIGLKLLNKMGWKQGQGIGPKVRRKADPADESSEFHLFAPQDAPMLSFVKKTDFKGLGYTDKEREGPSIKQATNYRAEAGLNLETDGDDERPGLSFASQARKPSRPKRGAFGVGIFNDTGSDDEDPYSLGPSISYSKVLGGEKRTKKNRNTPGSGANPLLKKVPVFIPRKISSISNALRKCHDGRLPLNGFVLATELDAFSNLTLSEDKYRVPPVPEGWKPSRLIESTTPSSSHTYQSTVEAAKSSTHTSSTRGNLLGESALPGKSVFDFLTPAARDKLMQATGKQNLPPALNETLPGTTTSDTASAITKPQLPSLDPQTALQALSRMLNGGFTPYNNDAGKSARYKAYLESQANTNTTNPAPSLIPQSNTSPSKHMTELLEFARTAEVFKPVSGLIASRFTTSSSAPTTYSSDPSTSLLSTPSSRPKDPAEEAARLGMFGPLTRTVANFYPTRLLCKRFGVAMPNQGDLPTGGDTGAAAAATTSRFQSSGVQHDVPHHHAESGTTAQTKSTADGRVQLAIEGPDPMVTEPTKSENVVVDPDKNEALEQQKPGLAVFRAIFGSDDDDDEDEDEGQGT